MARRKNLKSSGIFYDSSDLIGLEKWFRTGILGGATTNPLILEKEGVLNIPRHITKMIKIVSPGFPISIEIPDSEMKTKDMINLGIKYHKKFPDNAVIKVPMDPRDSQKALEVTYQLGQKGVRVNATLGLSMGQLVAAAEALRTSIAKGDNYISLFWARRDEAKDQIVKDLIKSGISKKDATELVPNAQDTLKMTVKYLEQHTLRAKIIVGSIRHINQIEAAFGAGADIVTIPPKLIEEWMYTHRGVETADQFNQAYRSVKSKIKLI